MKPFALYLHIPFCFHKCPYCDFNTYAVSRTPEDDYVAALLAEMDFRASTEEWRGRTVKSVYFGGGTPSLFSPKAFRKIIFYICKTFPVDSRVEITIEANPGTVNADNLSGYRAAGVNRISLGAQSFNPQHLKTLGRIHSVDQIQAAFEQSRLAGFGNISLDLIFGIPGQNLADFRSDLEQVVALSPEHISAYGLTIEKGTEFYNLYHKGKLILPGEDVLAGMMKELREFVEAQGYQQYEISNFCRRQKEARHNLAYWDGDDYLGLGAGAHSMFAKSDTERKRWSNFALPKEYMEKASADGKAESWSDTLDAKAVMFEFFFLGLRKTAGVNLREFEKIFGFPASDAYTGVLDVLLERQFLKQDGEMLSLTRKGTLVADSVIENFIYDKKSLPLPRPSAQIRMKAQAANVEQPAPMVGNG